MSDQRYSDNEVSNRDIPSFIEPLPPLIKNPFMRPRPQRGIKLFEEIDIDEPELVQVYLRLKPCDVPVNLYEIRSDRCLVTSLDTTTAGHGRRTQHNVTKMYTFSKIFSPDCDQKELFEVVVKENLKKLPEGQNFTLLTYGPSGSGKTYTLMGTVGSPGLIPRSLEYVFSLVEAAQCPIYKPAESGADKLSFVEQNIELQWVKRIRQISAPMRDRYRRMSAKLGNNLSASSLNLTNKTQYYIWVSFVEIYNEAIYDLLAPPEKRNKLRIREDSSGHVYVKGAVQAFVRSGEEAFDVLVAGKRNLVVAATGVHAHSSRSHCIFTITMLTETDGEIRTSCVRLCDLAGCERARATRNTGMRMQESRSINSSLHVLERCMRMLRRNQKQRQEAIVPYRESKLTRLLGSGLSGTRGEAVSMVVTLNPAPEYAHETKHVLSLAAVAQDIQINNTIPSMSSLETLNSTEDISIECSTELMRLRSENERLHFELLQSQVRNRELSLSKEEMQRETGETMKELVEQTKLITRQYYEQQLDALRDQMDEMKEEYEERLAELSTRPQSIGTPSTIMKMKVEQLVTKVTILEEELATERLARARAEKEVQHLRTCIEERDDKAFKGSAVKEDVVTISDDEYESDTDDILNASLEPVFRKDILNKSHVLNNSKVAVQGNNDDDEDSGDDDNVPSNKSSIHEKSDDSLLNYDMANSSVSKDKVSQNAISDDESLSDILPILNRDMNGPNKSIRNDNQTHIDPNNDKVSDNTSNNNESFLIKSVDVSHNITADDFSKLTFNDERHLEDILPNTSKEKSALITSITNPKHSISVDNFNELTYNDNMTDIDPVIDKILDKSSNKDESLLIKNICGEKHSITSNEFSKLTFNDDDKLTDTPTVFDHNKDLSKTFNKDADVMNNVTVSKYNMITSELTKSTYEKKENNSHNINHNNVNDIKSPFKISSEVQTTFITQATSSNSKAVSYQDGESHKPGTNLSRGTYFIRERSASPPKKFNEIPSTSNTESNHLVKDVESNFKLPTISHKTRITKKGEIKPHIVKTMVESFESRQDKVINVDSPFRRPNESLIIRNFMKNLQTSQNSNSSLVQFEQMEIATKEFKSPDKKMGFGDIKIKKHKKDFFDFDKEPSKIELSQYECDKNKQNTVTVLKQDLIKPQNTKLESILTQKDGETAVIISKEDTVFDSNISKRFGDTIINKEKKTNFDFIIEHSTNVVNESCKTDVSSNEGNLEQIINTINSSVADMNNLKDKRHFDKDGKLVDVKEERNKTTTDKDQSLSTVKEAPDKDFEFRKLLGDNLTKPELLLKTKHESMDIFDGFSPCSIKSDIKSIPEPTHEKHISNEEVQKDNILLKDISYKKPDTEAAKVSMINDEISTQNDTIIAFEDLYKNVSTARVTDFEMLVTDSNSNDDKMATDDNIVSIQETKVDFNLKSPKKETVTQTSLDFEVSQDGDKKSYKFNMEIDNNKKGKDLSTTKVVFDLKSPKKETVTQTSLDFEVSQDGDKKSYIFNMEIDNNKTVKDISTNIKPDRNDEVKKQTEPQNEFENQDDKSKDTKYNLRRRAFAKFETEPVSSEDVISNICSKSSREESTEDFIPPSAATTEKPRRPNLRLRRRKNQESEEMDAKLKNIVNLQSEFCDVTLNKPAVEREVKDIPSPEMETENLPPAYDIQSCPSKSVTRSRRKLFTPRAEPLDESLGPSDESGERIRVPRPSYHRPRARRKL